MKRLLALTGLFVGLGGLGLLGAAPAGAVTQHNTVTISFSHNISVANTGFNLQLGGGTITTAPANAGSTIAIAISQTNTN
jgi:hypothetical protein